eukprot:3452374-Amphidinium_carterae.1
MDSTSQQACSNNTGVMLTPFCQQLGPPMEKIPAFHTAPERASTKLHSVLAVSSNLSKLMRFLHHIDLGCPPRKVLPNQLRTPKHTLCKVVEIRVEHGVCCDRHEQYTRYDHSCIRQETIPSKMLKWLERNLWKLSLFDVKRRSFHMATHKTIRTGP